MRLSLPTLAAIIGTAFLPSVRAQFAWTNTSSASASWGTAGNWSGNSVPTSAITVNLAANLTTHQTITLGADRTVNTLTAGDPTGPLFTTTLTGNTLIFSPGVFGATASYDQSSSAGAVTIASAVTLSSDLTATVRSGAQTTISGAVGGTGTLTKAGDGTLTLSGLNSFTGGVELRAGTLALGSVGALGPSGQLRFNGGTLQFSAANTTDHSARFRTDGGQAFRLDTNGQDVTLASTLAGAASTLTKLGEGTLTLTGNNTYTGGTTLAAGTLMAGSAGALGTTGTIAFAGGTLRYSSENHTDYSARFATTAGQEIRIDTNRQNVTFATALTGANTSLTKDGAGTLTLTGENTYTGTTTISGGTLLVGNGGAAGSLGSGAIINNANLQFSHNDRATLANAISGSGAVSKFGNGRLTITADNSYTGSTNISAGTVEIGNGGTSGSLGSGMIINNGTLMFNRSDDATIANDIVGPGTFSKLGEGTLTLTGDNSYFGFTWLMYGTLAVGSDQALGNTRIAFGGGTLRYTPGITPDLSHRFATFTVQNYKIDTNGQNVTFASPLDGTDNALTKLGGGTLILTADNTYSGPTTVSGGTLQIGNGGNTGNLGSGPVINNASLLFLHLGSPSVPGDISGSGSLESSVAGTLTLSGNNTYTGTTTIYSGTLQVGAGATSGSLGSGNVITQATLAFNRSNALSVPNAISGSGRIVQLGTGTLTLTGNNTYTGGTTISAGTLRVEGSGTLGTGPITNHGALMLAPTATLTLSRPISGTGSLVKQGSGTVILDAVSTYSGSTTIEGGTLQLGNGNRSFGLGTGNIVNQGSLVFAGSETTAFANVISGTGSITKQGTGQINLLGANTYTGGTTIAAGTLFVGSSGSVGTGAIVNQGSLVFSPAGTTTGAFAISGAGTLRHEGTGTLILTGNNTYTGATEIDSTTLQIGNGGTGGRLGTGPVSISAIIVDGASLVFNRSDSLVVSNAISGNGALIKQGGGTLTLTGASTHSGTTSVAAGTLALGASNTTSASSVMNVASGATFDLGGYSTQVGGLRGAGNVTLGSAANSRLTINQVVVSGGEFSLVFSGQISGAGGLTKSGNGELVLSSANTYSGGTLVAAGIVRLANSSGSAFGTDAVTVAAGATLTGTGSFSGPLTLQGTLAPGNSPGLLTLGSGSILGGLTLMELAGTARGSTFDAIDVGGAGALTFGGTLTVALREAFSPVNGQSFDLFHFTTGSGTFATLNLPALGSGLTWDTSALYTSGTLSVSAIPEPGTWATLAGLAALVVAICRRRLSLRAANGRP